MKKATVEKKSEIEKLVEAKSSNNRIAMARGVIVLDENLSTLERSLISFNMRVVSPPKGMSDDDIKKLLLLHRIFITKNSKDFIEDASIYDYGVIALENIGFIDKKTDQTNQTAKIISKALMDYELWSKGHGFILILKPDGKHIFKNLTS